MAVAPTGGSTPATKATDCATCTAGYGCRVPNIRAECSAGFYCLAGAFTPRPNSATTQFGGMCVPGEYCANNLGTAT